MLVFNTTQHELLSEEDHHGDQPQRCCEAEGEADCVSWCCEDEGKASRSCEDEGVEGQEGRQEGSFAQVEELTTRSLLRSLSAFCTGAFVYLKKEKTCVYRN